MSRKILSKLTTVGTKTFFLLTTIPTDKEDGFELVLTDGQSVWNGTFSADSMDKQRKKLKMDFTTYFNQTEKAFTRADQDVNIEYSVKTRPDDTAELVWKKHVTSEDIKFQLGSITLMLIDDPGSSICDILNHSVSVNDTDEDRIKTLQTDNDRLSQERTMALKRLEKCVAAKEEMEKELFSKFVSVLNSKKEKLRCLKENGSVDPESQVEETINALPSTSSNNGTQRKREVMAAKEDISDKEENTDEEETPPPKRQRRTPGRKVAAGDADSSLDLGEESPTASAAVVKRPVRQRGGNKKNTPSRPVLPKVTRNQSSESNDGKGRMSKSSSNNSNISNIDPEDLFGDI